MMLNILSTFLNGKNAKQKILIFFFSFPFNNHFGYYYALYLLFLWFSLCLIFYISEYFPNIRCSVCVCVCACMCNICTYMFEYFFFFSSDKSTKLWLNYSALSLIAQLVMDREKKIILWDVCCELIWNNLVIQHSLGTFIKYWYLWKLEADGKWYGLPRWQ